jgi:hypothetical protein
MVKNISNAQQMQNLILISFCVTSMQHWKICMFHFRGFWMRTSKESGVYPDRCEADDNAAEEENVSEDFISSNIRFPRYHCYFFISFL